MNLRFQGITLAGHQNHIWENENKMATVLFAFCCILPDHHPIASDLIRFKFLNSAQQFKKRSLCLTEHDWCLILLHTGGLVIHPYLFVMWYSWSYLCYERFQGTAVPVRPCGGAFWVFSEGTRVSDVATCMKIKVTGYSCYSGIMWPNISVSPKYMYDHIKVQVWLIYQLEFQLHRYLNPTV